MCLCYLVPAKVRTSHDPTIEEILRAFREAPSASAREVPEAAAQRLDPADFWPSVVPLCGYLLFVGLWAIGQYYSDCERGSSNFCETTATSSTRTAPGLWGAALQALRHLRISLRVLWGGGLRSLFWPDGFAQR